MFSHKCSNTSAVCNCKMNEDNTNSIPVSVGDMANNGLKSIDITLNASGLRGFPNPQCPMIESMDAGSGASMRCPMKLRNSMKNDIYSPSTTDTGLLMPMHLQRMPSESSSMKSMKMNSNSMAEEKSQMSSFGMDAKSMPLGTCPIKLIEKYTREMMKEMHRMSSMQMDPKSMSMKSCPMKQTGMDPQAMMAKTHGMCSVHTEPESMSIVSRPMSSMGMSKWPLVMQMDPMISMKMHVRPMSMDMKKKINMDRNRSLNAMEMTSVKPSAMNDLLHSANSMKLDSMDSMDDMNDMNEMDDMDGMDDMDDMDDLYLNILSLTHTNMKSDMAAKMLPSDTELMESVYWHSMWNASEEEIKQAYMKIQNLNKYIKLVETERMIDPMAKSDISDAFYNALRRTLMEELTKLNKSMKMKQFDSNEQGKNKQSKLLCKL